MEARTATSHLRQARFDVRQALDGWNRKSFDGLNTTHELLVSAADHVRAVEMAVQSGAVAPTRELYANVLAVQQISVMVNDALQAASMGSNE